MEEKLQKIISYILQFTESPRFVGGSLLNLVNNLFAGIEKTKCK